MIVQARYGNKGYAYTFEAPDTVRVGDVLDDCGQGVTVVEIGSHYTGPVRALDRVLRQEGSSR